MLLCDYYVNVLSLFMFSNILQLCLLTRQFELLRLSRSNIFTFSFIMITNIIKFFAALVTNVKYILK